MCVQPTWSTCSLSSTSTTSTSRRLLSEFTQEHLANRRKLLADPSDKDSIVAAKESLQGVHPVGCASLHLQATASVHPFGCASLLLRATASGASQQNATDQLQTTARVLEWWLDTQC